MPDASENPARTPEQHPAITALTSMFPIHIDTPRKALPAGTRQAPEAPSRNSNRPPICHFPESHS